MPCVTGANQWSTTMKNIFDEKVELNDLEIKVLRYLARQDYWEDGSLIGIPDIDVEGLSHNQIKGYLSALHKKRLIDILNGKEYSFGCDCVFVRDEIIDQLDCR